jgi:hypothetical protein
LLSSSDSGNTWQYLDNQTFSNPRGIAYGNGSFLVMTNDKTFLSNDGGSSWQERSSLKNINLGSGSWGDNLSLISGSFTATRVLTHFNAEDLAFGDGKYLAIGSASINEYVSGSGTFDNGSGIQNLNYDNKSFYGWGNHLLSSSDSGNTWQYLDNQTFSNPSGITFSQ